jgi:hypothetical protein
VLPKKQLQMLPDKIPEICSLEIGRDLGFDTQRNEDLGLCVDFRSAGDFQAFAQNDIYTNLVKTHILPVLAARNAMEVCLFTFACHCS